MSGTLYIISAPSGAGKTSLVKALTEADARLRVSVSHTTREPRSGESDGEHYYFVDATSFDALATDGGFLEHAEVHGNRYGTARAGVARELDLGLDVILEIDWQGARQVRAALPEAVSVFILPPSRAALEQRLRGRGQDDDATITRRLAAAIDEMEHHADFDYVVVNDDFDDALADLRSIFRARRLHRDQALAEHAVLITELLQRS